MKNGPGFSGPFQLRRHVPPRAARLPVGHGRVAGQVVVLRVSAGALGIHLAGFEALALFPVAMLAGAASMLSGGLGSTEATLVALLTLGRAALVPATVATLWLATVMGMRAFGWLNARRRASVARLEGLVIGQC